MLKKYNIIQDRVNNRIKKWFVSKPVDNEKYLKAIIKSHEGNINTNFNTNDIQIILIQMIM